MLDHTNGISVSGQAELLNTSRGTVYYASKATSGRDLALMKAIDKVHLD
jgi:putative transposase